jgi:hypothetical protein
VSALENPSSAENPFSTRHVRPGAIAYRFPAGNSAAGLVERLRQNGWEGQIVGPHGSGKSALVAALITAIEQTGRQTMLIELHDGQRRLPVNLRRMPGVADGAVIVVDGYEQLGRSRRVALKRFCRRRGLGLVVTAHASAGLPDLFRTTTSLALARQIVDRLLPKSSSPIAPQEVNDRFTLHQGDMREVLFDLYDLYEQRRPRGRASNDATGG